MKHYQAAVAIKAAMSLEDTAIELNQFLAPITLRESERFDEVPGFVASIGHLEFTLQGIPFDLSPDELDYEKFYYFDMVCSSNAVDLLPVTLQRFPEEDAVHPNGYSYVSAFLCERLRKHTRLECDVAR